MDETKMYVVIGVLALILTGLFVYLFTLDKKVGKLEEQFKDRQKS